MSCFLGTKIELEVQRRLVCIDLESSLVFLSHIEVHIKFKDDSETIESSVQSQNLLQTAIFCQYRIHELPKGRHQSTASKSPVSLSEVNCKRMLHHLPHQSSAGSGASGSRFSRPKLVKEKRPLLPAMNVHKGLSLRFAFHFLSLRSCLHRSEGASNRHGHCSRHEAGTRLVVSPKPFTEMVVKKIMLA